MGRKNWKAINLAFAKELADDRKTWLKNFNRDIVTDYTKKHVTYSDIINKELIHFSDYDNLRSLAHSIDGLKISQRKILYGIFKKNLITDMKVAQLVGFVGEISSYHHGEQSLAKAVIAMAQNFVGSNNINLLYPSGQFGTRLLGGNDSASPRYIYTRLALVTRLIYHQYDDNILTYLDDDGFSIEPIHYVPIIPMILVNGAEGIGTGYKCVVPQYNPLDIIEIILGKLKGNPNKIKLIPWYNNFKGSIIQLSDFEFITKGTYTLENNILTITELPIGTWTEPYKIFLENTLFNDKLKGFISKIKNNSSESNVEFIIKFKHYPFETPEDMEKIFQLTSKLNTNNMYLHDVNGHIKKYETSIEIINDFFKIRIEYYKLRKDYILVELMREIMRLETKLKFIKLVTTDKNIFKLSTDKILDLLINHKIINSKSESIDFLLKIPFQSFSKEKVEELYNQIQNKTIEYDLIKKNTVEQMWINDLEVLKKALYN